MSIKLFVIDDDEIIHFLVKRNLKPVIDNIEVNYFFNGEDAIIYLTKSIQSDNLPHIILLDLNMPILDGWEFLHHFSRLDPKIKSKITVIILTSSLNPDDILKAQNLKDVSGFISKPISEQNLLQLINDESTCL
jgi:CheY-like chemotaxis protein